MLYRVHISGVWIETLSHREVVKMINDGKVLWETPVQGQGQKACAANTVFEPYANFRDDPRKTPTEEPAKDVHPVDAKIKAFGKSILGDGWKVVWTCLVIILGAIMVGSFGHSYYPKPDTIEVLREIEACLIWTVFLLFVIVIQNIWMKRK